MTPIEMEIIRLSNQADKTRKEGRTDDARLLFSRALALLKAHGASPATEATLLSNFGIFLISEGQIEQAVLAQRRALELDEQSGQPTDLAFSHHNLGMALITSGAEQEGLGHLKAARALREKINDVNELIFTYEQLATVYGKNGQIEEAREVFQHARVIAPRLANPWSMRGVTMQMALAEAEAGNAADARALAIEAVSYIEARRAAHGHLAPDLYDARYNRHYLSAIELFLDAGEYDSALNLIDRTRFRSGCDVLEGGAHAWGDAENLGPLLLPAFRSRELVLVDWVYPKSTWCFPFTEHTTSIAPLRVVTSDRKGDPVQRDLNSEWADHARTLLGQVQPVLDTQGEVLGEVDEVIFMPHGTGWQAPYAALTGPDGRFLCETHRMLLCPSLRYCRLTDRLPVTGQDRSLVIGDPGGNLPQARSEAEEVAAVLGAELLVGAAATRAAVLARLSQGAFDVVHFACHGRAGTAGLGAVALADGLLTTEDMMRTGLRANLVNLVACWSGFTTFSVWNELDGFIRTLLMLGVRNAVASVYPVGDAAGRAFSAEFYRDYSQSQSVTEAMRKGLVTVSRAHPVGAWCGLIAVGARSPGTRDSFD